MLEGVPKIPTAGAPDGCELDCCWVADACAVDGGTWDDGGIAKEDGFGDGMDDVNDENNGGWDGA